VHVALGRLPETQRLAIVLTHLQGLSYEEAGEVMGQPVNTVKSHAHRGRARLKVLLSDYVQEEAA
jgi:RNA polymerase sigma-70 factor (ECF subfamily)